LRKCASIFAKGAFGFSAGGNNAGATQAKRLPKQETATAAPMRAKTARDHCPTTNDHTALALHEIDACKLERKEGSNNNPTAEAKDPKTGEVTRERMIQESSHDSF